MKLRIILPAHGFILRGWRSFWGLPGENRLHASALIGFRRLSLYALCAVALLASLAGCRRKPAPDVMATVNGKEILRADVEKYYKAGVSANQQTPNAEQANIMRLNILRQMIQDEILQQRAAKLNLAASDEDVNAKLNEMKAPYTPEEFDKQLKQRGITLDDLKRDLRRSLTNTKVLNKEIESKINVTDAEIASYYAAHKSEFNLIEPQYHLAQIVVTSLPSEQSGNLQNSKATNEADAKKKIQTLQNRLKSGEDFGSLAMQFSENSNTSANGGDMGFVAESALHSDPTAYAAINKLKAGQISEILPVAAPTANGPRVVGYAIYKLISREPAGQRELNDPRVQQTIRQGLREAHAQLLKNAYFEVLQNEAKVHNYFAEQLLKGGQ
jgi:peptidyl-prolyl cis-trans isomerase SurA